MSNTFPKIIVCGGRDFTDRQMMRDVLSTLQEHHGLQAVIEGGARGADRLGQLEAKELGIPVTTMAAEWDRYGKSAGYRRNVDMANQKPDAIVAFSGGRGTQHMVDIGVERGIPTFRAVVKPDGARKLLRCR